jgi:uncharacterized protein
VVYGAVALIVKMDDFGLMLIERTSRAANRVGHALVRGVPPLLSALSVIGIIAMCWVGGHILLVGADELGWPTPYDVVHVLEDLVRDLPAHAVLAWLVNTAASAVLGLFVGLVLTVVVPVVRRVMPTNSKAISH